MKTPIRIPLGHWTETITGNGPGSVWAPVSGVELTPPIMAAIAHAIAAEPALARVIWEAGRHPSNSPPASVDAAPAPSPEPAADDELWDYDTEEVLYQIMRSVGAVYGDLPQTCRNGLRAILRAIKAGKVPGVMYAPYAEAHMQRQCSDIAAKDAALAKRHQQAKEMHAEISRLKADLAAVKRDQDAVWNYLKPNPSNDMPWSDEIIIAHDNAILAARAEYEELVGELKASLAAMTERTEKAELERDHLRRDLCEIADGCGVGVPDQEEAKRRIIALRIDLDAARAENAKLRALLREAMSVGMVFRHMPEGLCERIDAALAEGEAQ